MEPILALTLKQPHALKGAIKALCHLADPALLLGTPLTTAQGTPYTVHHLQQGAKGLLIVHIKSVTTPEAAQALGGVKLFLAPTALPPVDDDEVYLGSLIGRPVHGPNGAPLGTVVALGSTPAHDLLEIERPATSAHNGKRDGTHGGTRFLIPIHTEYLENLSATQLVLTALGLELSKV
jgi:16S rRNA processing protein RimM